ncbi:MAG TPA: hypothetical protein VFY42_02485 [Gemmatimonadales bacterium]|nr:hypothetical protein [Gemmatimonadales bacterium]
MRALDFSVFQVFSPALTTLSIPPRAALSPLRAFRFRVLRLGAVAFLERFEEVLRADFLADDRRFAAGRFFAAVRLADFLVAAMAVPRLA